MNVRSRSLLVLVASVAVGCGSAPSVTPAAAPSPSTGTRAISLPGSSAVAAADPTSAPIFADLDGLLAVAANAHREPLAVAIDDARVARPQSGFNATSIVWQAPVDGYETRYLFVFQEFDAPDLGPVRSARYFFAHWAAELDAGFGHYGGDLKTRQWMAVNRGDLFTDIDGLGSGNSAYHRISSRDAPHNAYTSTADLWRRATQLGASSLISPNVHLRPFRDDSPSDQRGASESIVIPYNTVRVGYRFDPAVNAYQRLLDGAAQVDAMDGQQVLARTIVVLYMSFRTDSTIEPGYNRPVLGFLGTGKALIFAEGRATMGTWSKPTEGAPTRILGPDGTELPLIRGRIFLQVVPNATTISY